MSRGEKIENLVTVRTRKDGSTVEVSLTISAVRDDQGRLVGTSTVARDVTQWKEQENERLSLIQELTAALATEIKHSNPAKTPFACSAGEI